MIKIMPRWNPNATEFEVSVSYHKTRGDLVVLPKPISKLLGTPNTIKFVVKGKNIIIKMK